MSKEARRQGMLNVKKRREEGVPMNCDQCNTAEPPGISYSYNAKCSKVLCSACDCYRRKHGQDRDLSKEVHHQTMLEIKKKTQETDGRTSFGGY